MLIIIFEKNMIKFTEYYSFHFLSLQYALCITDQTKANKEKKKATQRDIDNIKERNVLINH